MRQHRPISGNRQLRHYLSGKRVLGPRPTDASKFSYVQISILPLHFARIFIFLSFPILAGRLGRDSVLPRSVNPHNSLLCQFSADICFARFFSFIAWRSSMLSVAASHSHTSQKSHITLRIPWKIYSPLLRSLIRIYLRRFARHSEIAE